YRDARGAASAATDVDDASPAGLLHVWYSRLDCAQVAYHLLFEVAQDVGVAHGLDRAGSAAYTRRVVDHDVNATEFTCRRVDEVPDRVGVQGVTDDGDNLAARLIRQFTGRLL